MNRDGTVPWLDAKPGEDAYTYEVSHLTDDYGWVTETNFFDEIDEPVTTIRKRWHLVSEDVVTFHPSTELCPKCNGEGCVELSDITTDTCIQNCPTCGGSGVSPVAGEMTIE